MSQLAMCSYCRRMLVDGDPPAVFGTCVACGERIDRQRKRERIAMERNKERKPAQTREQLEAAGDPFVGMREGEE